MEIEILSICDAATDNLGKLNLLGIFDTVYITEIPATLSMAAIATKIRITNSEQGKHKLTLNITDNYNNSLIPKFEGEFEIYTKEGEITSSVNMIWTFQNIEIKKDGEYKIKLTIDSGTKANTPLYIKIAKPQLNS